MNPQAKKIRTINKIPLGNSKPITKNPSYNLPMGTPIQSKRPFANEKSPSNLNQGNFSARGSKNVNLKVSSSNFGAGIRNNDSTKNSYMDNTNNSFRMNSAGKKLDYTRKSVDSASKKTNSSVSNLYGVIKGKQIKLFFKSIKF